MGILRGGVTQVRVLDAHVAALRLPRSTWTIREDGLEVSDQFVAFAAAASDLGLDDVNSAVQQPTNVRKVLFIGLRFAAL